MSRLYVIMFFFVVVVDAAAAAAADGFCLLIAENEILIH